MTREPTPDRDDLFRGLVDAIGDHTPIDWPSAFSRDPEAADELRALQMLEKVASAHARAAEEFAGGPATLLEGTNLSHYRIVELISSGGMGVVYRARDERLGRDVALKVLHPERLTDPRMRSGLIREARLAASIKHPNVATVHDVGEDGGYVYIAMEFVEGSTLYDLVQGRPLPPSDALDYAIQIAKALQAAHLAGVIHRDLKTRNVCVTPTGLVKVLDFGIAVEGALEDAEATPEDLTIESPATTVLGTPAYMAPEVLRGARADARSDIWALGVCLHEMLAGERPFVGAAVGDLHRAILHQDPRDLPAGIDRSLRNRVSRCLNKEPQRRYQGAGEVVAALEALRDVPDPRRRWKLAKAVGVGLLVAGLGAGLWWVGRELITAPASASGPSLAVLATRNESGASEQQYLADGLTDQLINSFAALSHLRVLSRTTSDAIARAPEPTPSLARRYKLDLVLETAVLRAGDHVRVNARLIDAPSDRSIWVRSYDRPLEQIVTLDNEIVLGIVERLKMNLSAAEARHLRADHAVDPAAFQAFVRGRNLAMNRNYGAALELFQEAARIDSTYASAYAGIADATMEMLYYQGADPSVALPRAEVAAQRALSLDSTQADAHLARAFVYGFQLDWNRAVEELRRAKEDAPGSPQVYYRWSLYHGAMGHGVEAVDAMKQAVRLDPASPRMAVELGLAYLNARQVDDAAREFERVIGWDDGPERRSAHAYHARCLVLMGRPGDAIAELAASGGAEPSVREREELAYAQASVPRPEEARRTLARLVAMGPAASPLAIAATQLALGSSEAAVTTLLKACEHHDPRLIWLGVDQRFDTIRRDPRYDLMLKAMGLSGAPRS